MSEENVESSPSSTDVVDHIELPNLSEDDVNRFLQAHNATGPCAACGNTNFAYIDPPEEMHFGWQTTDSKGVPLRRGFNVPIIILACRACGALRVHAEYPIVNWLKENPAHANDESNE